MKSQCCVLIIIFILLSAMIFSIFMYVTLNDMYALDKSQHNFFNGLCRVIRNCSISGEIPPDIGDWSSLKYL